MTTTDLKVGDLVRIYAAPFAGQRARVAYLTQKRGVQKATVELLEPAGKRWLAGESARVPVAKLRKVDLP
jgi:hypothetical protein